MGKKSFLKESKEYIKSNKKRAVWYFVLRGLVLAALVASILGQNWNNAFMCVLTLVLFMIPSFLDRRLNVSLPTTLEVIILLFIFAAEILGEVSSYYLEYERWDDMLHTANGFIMAAIGFALIEIFNKSDKITFTLTPFFVAFFAFCFSMTTAIIWEFFEYYMDVFAKTDMQKDTIITAISSVLFNPEGANQAVTLPIDSIVVNGKPWDFGGYIDIGLIDTMHDAWVNFIGAIVFSVIGFFYVKSMGKGKFASKFIPSIKKESK
jgi:hypothetical protein